MAHSRRKYLCISNLRSVVGESGGPLVATTPLSFRPGNLKLLLQADRQLGEHELADVATKVRPGELRLGAVRLEVEPVHAAQREMRGAILRRVGKEVRVLSFVQCLSLKYQFLMMIT
jgi:hypothetical protein